MSHKGKTGFSMRKNKLVNLLRNSLRILFLVIFFHWVLWVTSYANCVNYQEAINDKEELKNHDSKTKKYQRFTGLLNKPEEKSIAQIEEDILDQIEKKKGLEKDDNLRTWKKEKLPDLEKLQGEIKKLEKKETPTKEEQEELTKKREDYNKKLEAAKEDTIKNIKKQLVKNDLDITELDDNRKWWERMLYDPLKFFIVSPLNKSSKVLGLHNHLFLEVIFKLVIVEIILLLIFYSETIIVWENMEKIRDPYLSVEEKEQLNEEAAPLVKFIFFNGFMMVLFNFFLFFHPHFFDRTTANWFNEGTGLKTSWFIWIFPIFFSLFLSNISSEFLRHGRLLNKKELKDYGAKNWMSNLLFALIILVMMRVFGMSSVGSHLLSFLGGLVKFVINTTRVKFFGHREHSPRGSTRTTPSLNPRGPRG